MSVEKRKNQVCGQCFQVLRTLPELQNNVFASRLHHFTCLMTYKITHVGVWWLLLLFILLYTHTGYNNVVIDFHWHSSWHLTFSPSSRLSLLSSPSSPAGGRLAQFIEKGPPNLLPSFPTTFHDKRQQGETFYGGLSEPLAATVNGSQMDLELRLMLMREI